MQNRLIINADDFGLSESCSKAIKEAFDKNLISSTTAMANGSYIENAFALAQEGGFSDKIGVHLNLTEGAPLTERIKKDPFFCFSGVFHGKINRLAIPTKAQLEEMREELKAQIERLLSLGFSLTHADSHHHIHTDLFFIGTFEEVVKEYGITKIRLHRNFGKICFAKRIVKNAYNAKLMRDGFISTDKMGSFEDLIGYPETPKNYLCEIMVHPDYNMAGALIDRVCFSDGVPEGKELQSIKDYVKGFELISFKDLR